jgi:hypothetical protein
MCWDKRFWPLLSFLLFLLPATGKAEVLTLIQAESLGFKNAKELVALRSELQMQDQNVPANSRLQSPSLQFGADYSKDALPSSPTDETTTMMLGVKQALPPLRAQALQSLTSNYLIQAHEAQIAHTKILILRAVREKWLSLYEHLQTQFILRQQLAIFQRSLQQNFIATQPRNRQKLQIQIIQLQNQIAQVRQQESILREQLKQKIGKVAITASLPQTLPLWPALPKRTILAKQLLKNPQLQADSHLVGASQQSVKLAAEQRNSGLNLSMGYGFEENVSSNNPEDNSKSNNNPVVNNKSNLVTLRLTIPLSSNSSASQDEEVAKKVQQLQTHQQKQHQDFITAKKLLAAAYQNWKYYNKQVIRCKKQDIAIFTPPPFTEQTPLALTQWLNQTNANFATKISCLHAAVSRAKAQVQVFYLLGK